MLALEYNIRGVVVRVLTFSWVLDIQDVLFDNLYEMNRRIRRRMITKGEVSLDVEDNLGPHEWPRTNDLTVEDIQYSVHLPLVAQRGKWPNGGDHTPRAVDPVADMEVVRILNIVVPESRLLSSRERCPFLVHLEVVDTGLEGHDARLYASGASSIGSTVEEALSIRKASSFSSQTAYDIPPELIHEQKTIEYTVTSRLSNHNNPVDYLEGMKREFPRGGSQWEGQYYEENESHHFGYTTPLDSVRQHEYEELHDQMHAQHPPPPPSRFAALLHR